MEERQISHNQVQGTFAENAPTSSYGFLHQRFEQNAARYPHNPAIVEEKSRQNYAELNQRANQLARCLEELWPEDGRVAIGSATEDEALIYPHERILGLYLPVGGAYYTCVLACMKAGFGWMPITTIEKGSSLQQLACQITEVPIKAIVYLESYAYDNLLCISAVQSKPQWTFEALMQQALHKSTENLNKQLSSNQIGHVMGTSGTTDAPKYPVNNLVGLGALGWACEQLYGAYQLSIKPQDNVLGYADVGFDAHLFDMVIAFWFGASLHCVPQSCRLNTKDKLLQFFLNHQITYAVLVPKVLHELNCKDMAFSSLWFLMSTGDKLTAELVNRWIQHKPGKPLIFGNGGGYTEVSIASMIAFISKPLVQKKVPVGVALKHLELFIVSIDNAFEEEGYQSKTVLQVIAPGKVDQQGQPIIGELYNAGIGVARGYFFPPTNDLKKHEKQLALQQRFRTVCFIMPDGSVKELRAFQTGDRACWENNQIVYCGRVVRQIKLNGQMVHPEQIEFMIERHYRNCLGLLSKNVSVGLMAVHVEKQSSSSGHREWLRAFLVLDSGSQLSYFLNLYHLAKLIENHLGLLKVPTEWLFVENTPTLWHPRSNKLRRSMLSQVAQQQQATIYCNQQTLLSSQSAKDDIENTLADIWRAFLPCQIDVIHSDDEFGLIGGDSIGMGGVSAAINKRFGLKGAQRLMANIIIKTVTFGGLVRHIKRLIDYDVVRFPKFNSPLILSSHENAQPRKRTLNQISPTVMDVNQAVTKRARRNSVTADDEFSLRLHYSPSSSFGSEGEVYFPVSFQRGFADGPIFFVHSLLGDAQQDYAKIVNCWGHSARQMYGFSARGLTNPEDQDEHMELIAQDIVQSIQQIQQQGLFLLVGWSAGGSIIYTVARLLAELGESVSIVMIDSEGPQIYQDSKLFACMLTRGYSSVIAKKFDLPLELVTEKKLQALPCALQVVRFEELIKTQLKSERHRELDYIISLLKAMLTQSQRILPEIRERMRVHLWWADQTHAEYRNRFGLFNTLGWQPSQINFGRELSGNHFDIMLSEEKARARAS